MTCLKPLSFVALFTFVVFALNDFSGGASAFAQGNDLIQAGDLEEFRNRPVPETEGFRFAMAIQAGVAKDMSQAELVSWMTYLSKRREILAKVKPDEEFEIDGIVVSDFEEEYQSRLALRDSLTEIYKDLSVQQKGYVDVLNKVHQAGFFADYVFRFHHQEHWDSYDGDLELQTEKFNEWAEIALKGHTGIHFGDLLAVPANRARAIGIFIDNKQVEVAEASIWLMYALSRFEFLRNSGQMPKALVDEIILPSIEEEIAGRQAVYTKRWEGVQASLSESSRKSFEAMKAADEAGFVKEFVWVYCRQSNWQQPEEFRLEEFKTWAAENIPDHPEKAPTFAALFGRQDNGQRNGR